MATSQNSLLKILEYKIYHFPFSIWIDFDESRRLNQIFILVDFNEIAKPTNINCWFLILQNLYFL